MARLYVGNLTGDISSEDLRNSFNIFGSLKDCWVVKNQGGFGFVEYYNTSHAASALQSMNNSSLNGTRIKVNYARPKNSDQTESRTERRTCFNCGQVGHIKTDCPTNTSNTSSASTQQFNSRLLVSIKSPIHWPLNSKAGQRIKVKDSILEQLKNDFEKSVGETATVIKIEEICNTEFYEKYEVKKNNLRKKLGNNRINEKIMYHGTMSRNIDAICAQNFDFRLCGTNATVYGKGSYFSTSAKYSNRYATPDNNDIRYMFLANVLVGKYTTGDTSMSRPPPIQSQRDHELYDSCVNDVNNPVIFVVFELDQCYPKYLISYKLGNHNSAAYTKPTFTPNITPTFRTTPTYTPTTPTYQRPTTPTYQRPTYATQTYQRAFDNSPPYTPTLQNKKKNEKCVIL